MELQKAVFTTGGCGHRGAELVEDRQGEQPWDLFALGFSCTPQSLGIWIHDQHSMEKMQLYAVF